MILLLSVDQHHDDDASSFFAFFIPHLSEQNRIDRNEYLVVTDSVVVHDWWLK